MSEKKLEPIWVESCLTPEDWKICKNEYSTYSLDAQPPMFPCHFMWRWGMGKGLSAESIKKLNFNLDEIKRKGGIKSEPNKTT
jgi:hypothetical protein